MLPQDTDWFRNCVAAEPHQYDTFYSTREKLERRAEFDRWLAEVKADAWQDGAYHIAGRDNELVTKADIENPYRQGEEQ